jgi:CubicO group peptidase (beta-lactamase class C family)
MIRYFVISLLAVSCPVSDTTVFHLASLTKPLASTVILQLVDEGLVSLDDPVSKYGIVLANARRLEMDV